MTSDIKVYGEQKNVYCLLYNAHYDIGNSKYLRMNIYCKNAVPFLGNKETNSITGYNTTWTAITNGYYNALYNIYIYNNLT